MIEKLTPEQEELLKAYRDKAFCHATSTKTNRKKAEKWALRLTSGAVKDPHIHWAKSPEDAKDKVDSLRDIFDYIFRDRLRDNLMDSLQFKLLSRLGFKLQDSLWGSLSGSLPDSIHKSLGDSLLDSLWDTGWTTLYAFAEKIGIEPSEEDSKRLECYRKLLKHCFAIYVLPGHIILVDKPKSVEIKDGKLVGMKFGLNEIKKDNDMKTTALTFTEEEAVSALLAYAIDKGHDIDDKNWNIIQQDDGSVDCVKKEE